MHPGYESFGLCSDRLFPLGLSPLGILLFPVPGIPEEFSHPTEAEGWVGSHLRKRVNSLQLESGFWHLTRLLPSHRLLYSNFSPGASQKDKFAQAAAILQRGAGDLPSARRRAPRTAVPRFPTSHQGDFSWRRRARKSGYVTRRWPTPTSLQRGQ
jgi:hypothetical protein